ncbi:MAG: PorT family protein [Paludibacteraceae bacterium]|nr:PorT family protein [Paludibacteraceae bacterium]
MKRIFFLVGMLAAVFSSSAKGFKGDIPKNIVCVEAGATTSRVTSMGVPSSHIGGVYAGVFDQISLTDTDPVYFETGLSLTQKGYKLCGFEDSKTRITYLELPLLINYRFGRNGHIEFIPTGGAYFSLGIKGTLEYNDQKIDVFDEAFNRFDCGAHVGFDVVFWKIAVGVAYEHGFSKFDKKDVVYGDREALLGYKELKNKSLLLKVGVHF